jgi:hypothetical protein
MHESLPPPLRRWVTEQAEKMGLPGPDDYILLLIRLDKQDHELQFPSPECRKRSAK